MASYHCLFLVLLLASPLFAIKCYTSVDNSYNAYGQNNLQVTTCNGKYCSREILTTTYPNGKGPQYSYMCGDQPGASLLTCSSTYDSQTSSYGQGLGTVNKMCCKGDYCNSTASIGSLLTVIASIAALFFNKMI